MNVSQSHVLRQGVRRVVVARQREAAIMAMNRIQFQPGLSMPEFVKNYGTEMQCEQALEAARDDGRGRFPADCNYQLYFCGAKPAEIGSASCRERVCQYV